MIDLTVPEIRRKLQEADAAAFAVLERSLVADTRKGSLLSALFPNHRKCVAILL